MPCSDGRCNEPRTIYTDNPKHLSTINKLNKANQWLEACLCALITEIHKSNSGEDIIKKAEDNGEIDINKFWILHIL